MLIWISPYINYNWLKGLILETTLISSSKVEFFVPQICMKILGVGYSRSNFSQRKYIKNGKQTIWCVDYSHNFVTAREEIIKGIKLQGYHHWLHFHCTIKFESMISSGPVFIENVSIYGIICLYVHL